MKESKSLEQDFNEFTSNYMKTAIGPAKLQVYVDFTKKRMPELVFIIMG